MGIVFRIQYESHVVDEDIPRLSVLHRARIKHAIETKLTVRPQDFGKPLRRSLKGYRKLRVGDHRVIFRIVAQTVKVFAIGHRSVVYTEAERRV